MKFVHRFSSARLVLAAATALGAGAIWLDPDHAPRIFLATLAAESWLFVILYWTRSNWRATAAGRAVMRLIGVLAVICTQGTVTLATDASYPGSDIIRPILLLAVTLAVLDMLLTLVQIQRRADERNAS